MKFVGFSVSCAMGIAQIICHATTGHWSWHLAVAMGLLASGGFSLWIADDRATDAVFKRRLLDEERRYGTRLTEEERAVVDAMRKDDVKRLRGRP